MLNCRSPQREHSAACLKARVALLQRRRSLRDQYLLFAAAVLGGGCSLLIESDDPADQNEPALTPGDPSGGASGSGPTLPSGGSSPIAAGEGGGGAGESPSDAGSGSLGAPDATVGDPHDAGAGPDDAAAPGWEGDAGLPPLPDRPALYLAFLEDPAAATASLKLVNARDALSSSEPADAEPTWRRTLRPSAQAGDALDFSWSPDGQRLALRYEAIDGPRIAFFEAPDWQELPVEELALPASQPRLTAAASYRWSPDSLNLAAELSGEAGPFVGGYILREGSAVGVSPVAFSSPVESMAWLSPTQLFVVRSESGEREIVTLDLNQDTFDQALLDTSRFIFPLHLRQIPTGIAGASVEPDSFLYFWPAAPELASEALYTGFSYLSAGQAFVAETDDEFAEAYLYPMGELFEHLDFLPDCSVVLTWADGPSPGSLAGSKIACLVVQGAAATISVYSYAEDGTRSALTLEDETLRTDFATAANWEGHARGFSPVSDWLALATTEHDILIDLRAPVPKYQIVAAASAGATARTFSPSGGQLLQQRGQTLHFTLLAPPEAGAPGSFPLLDAAEPAPACDTAQHMPHWCGAPLAASLASARWSSQDDIAVWLSRDEGLNLLSFAHESNGLNYVAVSTCGAACVTQYALAP